jgi:peptidoglycan/LPS O-acetylase OafA/YrhL
LRSLAFIRFALILAIVLYAAFGVLDLFIVPDEAASIWIVRYAIVCPVFLAALGLTFTHWFEPVAQPVLSALAALCGLGIVAMVAIANPSASALYYAGLLLVIPWAYSVLHESSSALTCRRCHRGSNGRIARTVWISLRVSPIRIWLPGRRPNAPGPTGTC